MAKGRKLTFSRSERFLETFSNGYTTNNQENGMTAELVEDDVWSTIDDNTTHHEVDDHLHAQSECPSRAPVMNGFRRTGQVGGLSLAFDDDANGGTCNGNSGSSRVVHQFRQNDGVSTETRTPRGRSHVASSAPVNVPDWSKIYRADSVESMHDSDGDDGDGDSEMIPPHEYLARSRKSAATSVFEGVGRTLKGRDLRRVRDAVWRQTGFDG